MDKNPMMVKPIPLPRHRNRNFENRDSKSPSPQISSDAPSDINSNIDNLMEPKPGFSKFSPNNTRSSSSKNIPVPMPRKILRNNGTSSSSSENSRENLPDLTKISRSQFFGDTRVIPGNFHGDLEDDDDDINYENIPSRPNLMSKESQVKRGTINIFKREVGDPFGEDFETSIQETTVKETFVVDKVKEPLIEERVNEVLTEKLNKLSVEETSYKAASTRGVSHEGISSKTSNHEVSTKALLRTGIKFNSPLEDLDEATRRRLSNSSASSSATFASSHSETSKSCHSDDSEFYKEVPSSKRLPNELVREDSQWNSGPIPHNTFSSNTVPARPKRSPYFVPPRLSALDEANTFSTSFSDPITKRNVEKATSCPPMAPSSQGTSTTMSDSDLNYEPVSWTLSSSDGNRKFNTISGSSANKKFGHSGNLGMGNNVGEYSLPVNTNFNSSKRATVPNMERPPFNIQSSLTNHSNLSQSGDNVKTNQSPSRRFDPTAYDISDVQRNDDEMSPAVNRRDKSYLGSGGKRRSLTSTVSNSDTGSDSGKKSTVVLRRHSSGRTSSTGSINNAATRLSNRESFPKKVHAEYDEVAIEDGNVVLLSHLDGALNNNSWTSLNSRNSLVQEFDPLFDERGCPLGMGFPITEKPLDLNDTQQHRYEYIDTDGEDDLDTSLDGSSTTHEGSPVPHSLGSMCRDNPGYTSSPLSSRCSREIRTIDEMYEPVNSPKEGISPKLSPKPKMGTRVLPSLKISEDHFKQPPSQPLPQLMDDIDSSRNSLIDPSGLGIVVPAPPPSQNQSKFFRKLSSKFRLNAIKEEKDADKKSESLVNIEEGYGSLTTPCNKCFEPHPESTKCKFAPNVRETFTHALHLYKPSGLKKEFSKKWVTLKQAKLSFYNEKNDLSSELAVDKFLFVSKKDDHKVSQSQTELKCFELGLYAGKGSTYVFATTTEEERYVWMLKFMEMFTAVFSDSHLIFSNFDRAGWCFVKERVTGEWRPCWIMLKERVLFYCYWKNDKHTPIDLRKARSVVLSQKEEEYTCPYVDNGDVLTVDAINKFLYIQTVSTKATASWERLIKTAATKNGSEFIEMQLTLDNVPVIVGKCIDFLDVNGIILEGIYRQSGSNTRITQLLQAFKSDAWAVKLQKKDYSAHDVAGTLKRFFRTLPEPLVTVELYDAWIRASTLPERAKKEAYMELLEQLPEINYNIMKKLMCHLYGVHDFQETNLMPLINLAPIWGPTLMNVDTSQLAHSYEIVGSECDVIKDLIENCYTLFQVNDEQVAKEEKMREALRDFNAESSKRKDSGDMKYWIYIWEMDESSAINMTLTPTGTAEEMINEICAFNKIKNMDNLALHEVICNDALERPLHPSEKVIEAVLRWSIWLSEEERKSSYLILKKNTLYPTVIHYAKEPKAISGELKYADSKSKSFRKYTFQFSQAMLKYYKDSKSTTELGSWKIEDIIWYVGCEAKRSAPPTRWTFTVAKRHYTFKRTKEEPYFGNVIACSSEDELHKWIGAMLIGEHPEGLGPII